MKYWRKEQPINLDLAGYEFADLSTGITLQANTEQTLIEGCPENLFKLYYTDSLNETIKKGETKNFSWKNGSQTLNITLTATSEKVTVLSDTKFPSFGTLKLQGYRVLYYDYPTEEVAAATTALYTLDEAAEAITQEVKASE